MTEANYIRDHMPAIDAAIIKAEGRIMEQTGITLKLTIADVQSVDQGYNSIIVLLIKCCKIWKVAYQDIVKPNRSREIVAMRKLLALLVRTNFVKKGKPFPLDEIAPLVGVTDHSTVINHIRTVKGLLSVNDPLVIELYEPIKHFFNEPQKVQNPA